MVRAGRGEGWAGVCMHLCTVTTVCSADCKSHSSSNGRPWTDNWRIRVLVAADLCLKPAFECCVTSASHLPFLAFSFIICKMSGLDKISGSQINSSDSHLSD